ncbi:hypothetical protein D3C72_962420 [compost metagenome]
MHDKLVQHAEVIGTLFWPGQDKRQDLIFIRRVHQNTQQIKQLFRRSDAAREDNDPVCDTHEGFETFLDIRHDDQLIHQRVRWLGRDNGRLRHTNETAFFIALLRVADRCAFHWRFHRARTTTGADIQFAQAELGAYAACVEVFSFVNGVAAPADNHVRCLANVQGASITQNGKDQVGHVCRAFQIKVLEAPGIVNLSVNKQDVAQHGEQVGLQ